MILWLLLGTGIGITVAAIAFTIFLYKMFDGMWG